jgi:hypothetical protein
VRAIEGNLGFFLKSECKTKYNKRQTKDDKSQDFEWINNDLEHEELHYFKVKIQTI